MVVCNSPPFGLPSRECGCAEDYFDKTVEQLAEEMGQKVMITAASAESKDGARQHYVTYYKYIP